MIKVKKTSKKIIGFGVIDKLYAHIRWCSSFEYPNIIRYDGFNGAIIEGQETV